MPRNYIPHCCRCVRSALLRFRSWRVFVRAVVGIVVEHFIQLNRLKDHQFLIGSYTKNRERWNPLGYRGANKYLKKLCERLKIRKLNYHWWRHRWATRLAMAGVDMFTLCHLGGWSSPKMVLQYYAYNQKRLSEILQEKVFSAQELEKEVREDMTRLYCDSAAEDHLNEQMKRSESSPNYFV